MLENTIVQKEVLLQREIALSEEREARAMAEKASRRFAFLAEASSILASSLDLSETLQAICKLSLNGLAEACAIDLIREDGTIEKIPPKAIDPVREAHIIELRKRYTLQLHKLPDVQEVVRRGNGAICFRRTDEILDAVCESPEHRRAMEEAEVQGAILVMLVARGRRLGWLILMRMGKDPYTLDDLAVGEDLASRAAVAIDNARLYEKAQKAVRIRDEFISIASHELRTPLTSLSLQVQLVLDLVRQGRLSSLPPEKLTQVFGSTHQQLGRITWLVNSLLDVSQIRSGKLHLSLEAFDLVQLVREVIDRYHSEIRSSGTEIDIQGIASLHGAWDRRRIEQTFTNLLMNALKYGQKKPVTVRVEQVEDDALLSVEDRGMGIAPEDQARIFQRFERAVPVSHYGGMGLGLYIAQQIASAHQGSIQLKSELGRGSVFELKLPMKLQITLGSPAA